MKTIQYTGLFFLVLILSACSGSPESRGTLAKVDGKVRLLSEDEVDKVCESNLCEPNYVYYASFGGSRPKPKPKPLPPPPPAPPTPQPQPPKESELRYDAERIGLEDAWTHTKGEKSVIVAVVDTGVDFTHPDLAGAVWVNEAEKNGRVGFDDDGNGYIDDVYGYDFANNRPNAFDDQAHGTHVAGIIASQLNGTGSVGVAPNVRVMPVKFLGEFGGTTQNAIKAINYAVEMGANIISNSWGGGGRSELLDEVIQAARAKGILVVAAAGNASSNNDMSPNFPSNYEGVISVASSDAQDHLSSFSNYGPATTKVAAPGSDIFSTVPGGQWKSFSGTSMATPQVSGALALALSVNAALTEEQVFEHLCESSDKILTESTECGRLNVSNLLSRL